MSRGKKNEKIIDNYLHLPRSPSQDGTAHLEAVRQILRVRAFTASTAGRRKTGLRQQAQANLKKAQFLLRLFTI
ncbi:hypothetical protein [Paracoccus fistulariae]|uniref:Uncharacterized protein n=2 Tax=Paracoccus fistulariae TaxID=658446 RepID=A0ABY7SNN7_9RHOB|nr:hypothetical protein [Paracoccus fistulariae]WCR08610.1 hypothetical protein JHX87_07355 [Paracoccus fistulariae]